MKGGNASNTNKKNLDISYKKANQELKSNTNTNSSKKNTIKLGSLSSVEFKKKELIRMYGKYLNEDLLNKDFYDEITIHTLYNDFITNNKEITININENEIITFN